MAVTSQTLFTAFFFLFLVMVEILLHERHEFCVVLAGGSHRHLQQDDLPVLRRVALVYVPGEARRAVEGGGAVFARVNLRGVHEAQVSLLAGPAAKALPAHRAQQAIHRAQIEGALV